jgi:hypothetical protein
LNVVVGDEAENAALGVHGGFVVDRAVFEVRGQMRRYAVAVHDLDKVATARIWPCSVSARKPCNVPSG